MADTPVQKATKAKTPRKAGPKATAADATAKVEVAATPAPRVKRAPKPAPVAPPATKVPATAAKKVATTDVKKVVKKVATRSAPAPAPRARVAPSSVKVVPPVARPRPPAPVAGPVAAPVPPPTPALVTPPPAPKGPARLSRGEESAYVLDLVTRIVNECPRRQPCSDDERRASEMMRIEFERLGLAIREHPFEFSDNLYANALLHSLPALLGTAISGIAPALALPLHLLPAVSYYLESTRKAYLGRRLMGFKPSRNILGVVPAETPQPALRIVMCAHVDAAFTGFTFWPGTIKAMGREPPFGLKFIHRSMELIVRTQVALAGLDIVRMILGPLALPLRPLEWLLTVPSLGSAAANIDIVLRNTIVPGANDDLSGVAALPLLARRLVARKRPDVELVFIATGCEEASLGGGDAIARDFDGEWDKTRTVVVGLDGLANGDLRYAVEEGEIVARRIPGWLDQVCKDVTASEPRFAEVTGFEIPIGGSDVSAFLARGWEGVCLICVDPEIGAPRHYHMPSDTPENLEVDKVLYSIDYAEKLVDAIVKHRLG